MFLEPLGPDEPREIGSYRLQGRLGQGGMGTVYLGRSRGGMLVAVKVVGGALSNDPSFRVRFEREVEAARSVGGFYTAHVVDADTGAARPWMATSYIPGPSLQDAVDRHGALPAEVVRAIGAGLAEGLETIHSAGLVHRDLKPGNVILAADGPRVIDFGIARALDATSTLTSSVLGSVAYMPPEQAAGGEVDAAGDVFALGCVLGFAATGRSPFGDGNVRAVLSRVMLGTSDLSGVPESLHGLVEGCLAPEPGDRPRVADVLEQLTEVAGHASPSARPWMTPGIAAMIAERSGIAGVGPGDESGVDDPDATERIGHVRTKVMEHKRPAATGGGDPVRRLGALSPTGVSSVARKFGGQHWPIAMCVLQQPDGSLLLATVARSSGIRIWDPETGKQVRELSGPESVSSLCALPQPDRAPLLASAGERVDAGILGEVLVKVWDPATGALLRTFTKGRTTGTGAVSEVPQPNSSPLLAYADEGEVKVWDPVTGREVRTLDSPVSALAMCSWPKADGSALLTVAGYGNDNAISIRDPATGADVHHLRGHTDWVNAVCVLPQHDASPLLASGGRDTVLVWDPSTGIQLHQLSGHMGEVKDVCAIPLRDGGSLLATVGVDQMVRVWDPVSGGQVTAIATGRHPGTVEYLGDELVVGTADGILAYRLEGEGDLAPGPEPVDSRTTEKLTRSAREPDAGQQPSPGSRRPQGISRWYPLVAILLLALSSLVYQVQGIAEYWYSSFSEYVLVDANPTTSVLFILVAAATGFGGGVPGRRAITWLATVLTWLHLFHWLLVFVFPGIDGEADRSSVGVVLPGLLLAALALWTVRRSPSGPTATRRATRRALAAVVGINVAHMLATASLIGADEWVWTWGIWATGLLLAAWLVGRETAAARAWSAATAAVVAIAYVGIGASNEWLDAYYLTSSVLLAASAIAAGLAAWTVRRAPAAVGVRS